MPPVSGSSPSPPSGPHEALEQRRVPRRPGRPGPSSSTQRAIRRPSTAPPTRTTEPGGENLLALARRLTKTWVRRGASPRPSAADRGGRSPPLPALAEERRASSRPPPRPPRRAPPAGGGSNPGRPRCARSPAGCRSAASAAGVPRSSESTSSRVCGSRPSRILEQAVAQQLDRGELGGERGAELVRDVGQHGVAQAAGGLDARSRRAAPGTAAPRWAESW